MPKNLLFRAIIVGLLTAPFLVFAPPFGRVYEKPKNEFVIKKPKWRPPWEPDLDEKHRILIERDMPGYYDYCVGFGYSRILFTVTPRTLSGVHSKLAAVNQKASKSGFPRNVKPVARRHFHPP